MIPKTQGVPGRTLSKVDPLHLWVILVLWLLHVIMNHGSDDLEGDVKPLHERLV
jgi:hypothetical protein